jgi:hypothetical protein
MDLAGAISQRMVGGNLKVNASVIDFHLENRRHVCSNLFAISGF